MTTTATENIERRRIEDAAIERYKQWVKEAIEKLFPEDDEEDRVHRQMLLKELKLEE